MKGKSLYFRIAFAMSGAFILSRLVLTVLFPTNTPSPRPDLAVFLKEQAATMVHDIFSPLRSIDLTDLFPAGKPQPSPQPNNDIPPYTITDGESVIAGSVRQQLVRERRIYVSPGMNVANNETSYLTTLKQQSAEWTTTGYTIHGEAVLIRIPSNMQAPSAESIERMY